MKRINKYLFLDVDGVLNSDEWYHEEWNKDHVYPQGDFDPKCIDIINDIVSKTDCKVIVSSSWRTDSNLQSVFDKAGLKFQIYSTTPFRDHRGKEIQEEYPKPITLMRYIRKAIDSGELVIATTDAEV